MIECPYCKSMIDDSYTGKACPQCGGHIYTPEFLQQVVDSRIRILRKNSTYEKIVKCILNGDFEAATVGIRSVIGRVDTVAEPAIIDKILHGPSILLKPAPIEPTHSKKQAYQTQKTIGLVTCPACHKQISTQAETCPHCGHQTGVHVCPKCNSTNTKAISGASKATSIFLWGPFAANKVLAKFQCKDCGHNF